MITKRIILYVILLLFLSQKTYSISLKDIDNDIFDIIRDIFRRIFNPPNSCTPGECCDPPSSLKYDNQCECTLWAPECKPPNPETTTTILSNNFCPQDTECTAHWPHHEGELLTFEMPTLDENNYVCDLFEVCHEDLDYIAEEANECCNSNCNLGDCHNSCNKAVVESDSNMKKCRGLYVIYGLGIEAKFMEGYFAAELCCVGSDSCDYFCDPTQDMGKCQCHGTYYPGGNTDLLQCPGNIGRYPRGWNSDTDMSQNSCRLSVLPAHASILEDKGIHTGTCVDYSIATTTLLRKVGFKANEVFTTLNDPNDINNFHGFTLARFPGESKFNAVETTSNKDNNYRSRDLPDNRDYDKYCRYRSDFCVNDNGRVNCPPKSDVYGC